MKRSSLNICFMGFKTNRNLTEKDKQHIIEIKRIIAQEKERITKDFFENTAKYLR